MAFAIVRSTMPESLTMYKFCTTATTSSVSLQRLIDKSADTHRVSSSLASILQTCANVSRCLFYPVTLTCSLCIVWNTEALTVCCATSRPRTVNSSKSEVSSEVRSPCSWEWCCFEIVFLAPYCGAMFLTVAVTSRSIRCGIPDGLFHQPHCRALHAKPWRQGCPAV